MENKIKITQTRNVDYADAKTLETRLELKAASDSSGGGQESASSTLTFKLI